MKSFRLLALMLLLILPLSAQARIVVLVHGYLSDGRTWEENGITAVLAAYGWQYAGQLIGGGIVRQPQQLASNRLYVSNLPFTAPLMWQSRLLQGQLNMLSTAYPNESITLVGHSAGGVVARLALVNHGAGQVDHLVTIAAPHLGTPLTYKGLDITDNHGPFEIVKEVAGGETYKVAKLSRGLYHDLQPPRPGSLLYWLNAQAHPDIRYTSVIRDAIPGVVADDVVPTFSQDMNQIPALQGRVSLWRTPAPHYLRQQDAVLLFQILNNKA